MNLDKAILEIEQHGFNNLNSVPARDVKILKSLFAMILHDHKFLTENQSKLLQKILTDNKKSFSFINWLDEGLANPTWSKPFRKVDQTRKIFTTTNEYGDLILAVEFAFNSSIRKTVNDFYKKITGGISSSNGRLYTVPFTEQNLVFVLEELEPYNFEVQPNLQEIYKTIKSWNFSEICENFDYHQMRGNNFMLALDKELTAEEKLCNDIIQDRRTRFNYTTTIEKSGENSVKNLIINRPYSQCWINNKEFSLDEVIRELVNLKRLPLLVVFDNFDQAGCLDHLKNLEKSLEKNGIQSGIGIYFRFDNQVGKEFNEFIKFKKYNAQLDNTTKVAGIASGKIPKFFLTSPWKPMAILSLGNRLRNSKAAVYANRCDLIIEYAEAQSIIEHKNAWLQ